MRQHDLARQGQANAATARLGAEERQENFPPLWRNARSIVRHGEGDAVAVRLGGRTGLQSPAQLR